MIAANLRTGFEERDEIMNDILQQDRIGHEDKLVSQDANLKFNADVDLRNYNAR